MGGPSGSSKFSLAAACVRRESTLVLGKQSATGTPVDAVTRIGRNRTEWQADLGLSAGWEGHGVNPETDCSRGSSVACIFHSFSTSVEIAGMALFAIFEGSEGMNSWEKILQHMERRVNPHSFATWFRPTRQEGAENGKLVVRVPSRPFRKRLTETYGELLQAVLVEVGMPDTQLEFRLHRDRSRAAPPANRPRKQTRLDFDSVDHQLNPRYTFDTFVVGGVEPVRACRGAGRGRSALEGLQPALPLRRRGHGQDPPDAGHRPSGQDAQSRRCGSPISAPRNSPTK